MIQNEGYEIPEFCGWEQHTPSLFGNKEDALELLVYIVDNGYPIEDYSIVEINKIIGRQS